MLRECSLPLSVVVSSAVRTSRVGTLTAKEQGLSEFVYWEKGSQLDGQTRSASDYPHPTASAQGPAHAYRVLRFVESMG